MSSPKKIETRGTYLIVHFADSVKHIDMQTYLKEWKSTAAQRLLKNISTDLSKVYLEDGYAISWPGYNLSIDPETFYQDALDGYPVAVSASIVSSAREQVINALRRVLV